MRISRLLVSVAAAFLLVTFAAATEIPADKAAIKPGSQEYSLQHGGLERTFVLHIPPQYDGAKTLPVVVMLHGGMGTGSHAEKTYGWGAKADKEGFIGVFPNGTGGLQTWNAMHCCGQAFTKNIDDVGFIRELLATLKKALPVDEKRIYVTGMSNGAMMTYRIGAELSELVAAIAPVAGSIGGKHKSEDTEKQIPQPKNPVPVIIFHGHAEENVLYDGGETKKGVEKGRIDQSVADAVKFWTKANGCETTPKKTVSASGNIITEVYADPKNGNDVVLYTIEGQGHAWPGTKSRIKLGGGATQEISATDLAWEFFAKHPKH